MATYTTPPTAAVGQNLPAATITTDSTCLTELQGWVPLAGTNYTPVVTASTTNPTGYTATGRYIQVGALVVVSGLYTVGTGTGSGTLNVTVPIAPNGLWFDATNFKMQGSGFIVQGTNRIPLWCALASGSRIGFTYQTNLTGTIGTVSTTAPFTIAAGNTISWQVVYETA